MEFSDSPIRSLSMHCSILYSSFKIVAAIFQYFMSLYLELVSGETLGNSPETQEAISKYSITATHFIFSLSYHSKFILILRRKHN
jgi:hypothetical protein